ncbi:hypothetical protein LTA6_001443 [Microbacterium sp. LTA6]|uniref:hypothetical protein n=1 Tax=Microbacterium sp. LTA6 TaxID=3129771 RepID=UPI00324B018B
MSGDSTDAPQDSNPDAAAAPPMPVGEPALTAANPPVVEPDLADPNSVVPDFEVPAPPTFGSATSAPGAETVVPDPIIPEPVLPASALPERVVPPAPAAPPAPPAPAPVTHEAIADSPTEAVSSGYTDANPYLVPGTAAPNSYRGWTIGIFTGLVVLLIGAVIALVYLFNNAPWEFAAQEPSAIESSTAEPSAARPVETTAAEPVPVAQPVSEQCGELCVEVSSVVGESVTGADGAVTWQLSDAWETADVAVVPASETAGAKYESSVGTISFTVWGFDNDAGADAAYATLAGERGEADVTDEVFEGKGIRNDYLGAGSLSILWSVTGDESQPWVLFVEGPDDEAVRQFYYSLPI